MNLLKFIQNEDVTDITKSENVQSKDSEIKLAKARMIKNSGVATQKKRVEDCKKVSTLVEVIYDIMKIYGYSDEKGLSILTGPELLRKKKERKEKTISDKLKLRNRILEFVYSSGYGSWKDFFKYKINAFFSHVMEQEVPMVPKGLEIFPDLVDPSFLVYGRGKRFLSKLMLNPLKIESFAQSIAQSKKGAPPVSPNKVAEAERECFLHLTTERADMPDFDIVGDNGLVHSINRDTICYQLRRTVREVYSGRKMCWDELTRPFIPSTSSHYNFNRDDMGAVGAFLSNKDIMDFEKKSTFVKKELGPVVLTGELSELYGKAGKVEQERIDKEFENFFFKETIGLHYDGTELCELWRDKIYPKLLDAAFEESPKTIVIGLPEPLKVRCITAGPALTQTVLKPMQKWLWKHLKSQSVFQLIGGPVTSEIVKKQLGVLGIDEEFISGDYKASTDNLHSWVSECLLDSLVELWKDEVDPVDPFFKEIDRYAILMRKVLTGHMILDPDYNIDYRMGFNLRDEWFSPQKEGQLMGSIISFPFLCLANAALCRFAMEVTHVQGYRVTDTYRRGESLARLLVNGDDCVFPGKVDRMFQNWKLITGFGGLESSVGKTFKSRKFMTINSVQYKYLETDYDLIYETVSYVNMGLIYGQKKDGTRGKPFYRMGAVHRDLQKTCPPEYFAAATKLFLKEARKIKFRVLTDPITGKVIKDKKTKEPVMVEDYFGSIMNAKVPFFFPEWLGGLGLVCTDVKSLFGNHQWRDQLRVADFIRSRMSESEFCPKKLSSRAEWQFYKLSRDKIEDFSFLDNQNFTHVNNHEVPRVPRVLKEEASKLFNFCVVDAFLTTDISKVREVFHPLEEEKVLRAQAFFNQKVWLKAQRHFYNEGFLIKNYNMDLEDLQSESKEFFLACYSDAN
jgi:hypothetical protein